MSLLTLLSNPSGGGGTPVFDSGDLYNGAFLPTADDGWVGTTYWDVSNAGYAAFNGGANAYLDQDVANKFAWQLGETYDIEFTLYDCAGAGGVQIYDSNSHQIYTNSAIGNATVTGIVWVATGVTPGIKFRGLSSYGAFKVTNFYVKKR